MIWNFWSPKGGSGCSTAVAVTGHWRSEQEPVLLVDLGGDLAPMLGVEAPGPGLADWLVADSPPPDALGRLEVDVGAGLSLLPWTACDKAAGSNRHRVPEPGRSEVLARILADDRRLALVDAGPSGERLVPEMLRFTARSIVVTRACYLSLRLLADRPAPDEVVLLVENGRALRAADVEKAAAAPVTAELRWDAAVARSVDAGRLLHRPPRSLRPLRQLGRTS